MFTLLAGDCLTLLEGLPDQSVHCCITSPPYYQLRNYDHPDQVGREQTPGQYVQRLVEIFREVRRVLRKDGTLWLNLGDTFGKSDKHSKASGIKRKDLCGMPWRVAFALQDDGWYLRCDCIWHKSNATPESVSDRPSRDHEYVFLLARSPRYYYDREAVRQPSISPPPRKHLGGGIANSSGIINGRKGGKWDANPEAHGGFITWNPRGRNRRSVWTTASSCFLPTSVGVDDVTHYAAFPTSLITPCILASTAPYCCDQCGTPYRRQITDVRHPESEDTWNPGCHCIDAGTGPSVVLDNFGGTGTTGVASIELGRDALIMEMNPDYRRLAEARMSAAMDRVASRNGGLA